jgi:nucleoside-diphosphate-sugar epimerase
MTLNLITGAPGWLGTRFVQVLTEGLREVPALAEPEPGLEARCLVLPGIDASGLQGSSGRVELAEGDICRPDSLSRFFEDAAGGTLYYLAGLIHPTRGIRQLYDVNLYGTRNVLDAAIRAGVRRVVAISSNSPVGCNPHKDHRFDEQSPYNPYLTYGRTKKALEDMLNEAHAAGKIEAVILRPCWFYGPGQPPRQTLFFTMIKEGKFPLVGGGENRRSLSYVDNTCQGLLLAGRTTAAAGQTYWIADERPYSMSEIIDTVERLLEQEFHLPVAHKRFRLPGLASEVAYAIDWALQAVGRYNQKIHVLSEMNKTIACSVEKAKQQLGYRPVVALEEGMRRSIKWCLHRGDVI